MRPVITESTPIIPCFIRNEFMFDQTSGHGEFTDGYLFGFRGAYGRIPCFQFMTVNGAQWTNVPVHMLTTKKGAAVLEPHIACWWDCVSDRFAVTQLAMLTGISCECRGRDDVSRIGKYLFTIDWEEHFGDVGDKHKQHQIIALDEGQLVAYPNNKIIWKDFAWYEPFDTSPDYLANTHNFSSEVERTSKVAPRTKAPEVDTPKDRAAVAAAPIWNTNGDGKGGVLT